MDKSPMLKKFVDYLLNTFLFYWNLYEILQIPALAHKKWQSLDDSFKGVDMMILINLFSLKVLYLLT